MIKNKISAISFIIGCAFFTEANAMQPECLSGCVKSFDGCTTSCNKKGGETFSCYVSCQGSMDSCFSRCGMTGFDALADHAKSIADEAKAKAKK